MKKSFALVSVSVVLFLLMVLSYLLPTLWSVPLWVKVACIVYQFAFYTMLLAFFVFIIVKKKYK